VLTEEKLDDIGARLEHTPRKSLKRLAQETIVSTSSARTATQFLKLRPYKTTVIYALQPRDLPSKVHFCIRFLQFVVEGEIGQKLTFFFDEAWFHMQGYINTQNNRYWIAQNPHLTHEVLLHPVKVGVWCAISARMIVGLVFFKETINCEKYLQVILRQFFPALTEKERPYGFSKAQPLPTLHVYLCRVCPMSSGSELSAVLFGQDVHAILILVIFSYGFV
jgi:hypothetical protein